jgi:two-component system LytT family response regulator
MNIFILDDEPAAVRTIEALLEQYKGDFPVEIIEMSNDPVEAIPKINKLKPEVLFLDVEMPIYSGFDVLKQITYSDFLVIFVTAYRDYAVEAFKANAIHYIVKPVSPKAFNKCLVRINESLMKKRFNSKELETFLEKQTNKSIAIYTKDGYEVISPEEIVCVLSNGAYSEFYLENGKIILQSKNLKYSESILSDQFFKRISRFTIVNLLKVVSFSFVDGGLISLSNGKELYIGKTYREKTFDFLKEKYALG